MKLDILNSLPEGFFNVLPENITDLFPNPTLISLEGEIQQPLFISTLLHGNELSSLEVIKKILKNYNKLPRNIIVFIGNTQAAKQGLRQLPDQMDFNRIWAGGDAPECQLAQDVLNFVKDKNLWASVDLHNNTGINPLYGCINKSHSDDFVKLASLFARDIVYFKEPHSVQAMAFSQFCPSTTLECGVSMDPKGIEAAFSFLKKLLSIESFDEISYQRNELNIFRSYCKLSLKTQEFDFDFKNESPLKISLMDNIDQLNFKEIPAGTLLAYHHNAERYLRVIEDNGDDITDEYLDFSENKITLKKMAIPSMLTKNTVVAYSDCLGYFMQHFTGEA
ncbi:MAG: succinylglutamate desuccinylase/aspartoacylase family protein [Halobacteriovoraceae bacterium]|nr:succinylglutamate desuccinylase/aspartoacylase family protein [Halobacteriovoraceae bacterium]MCB9095797.1 succinylglutamate desuccinylase/aspartoacylase family protein [Halobacteriovoraceae bacterium]